MCIFCYKLKNTGIGILYNRGGCDDLGTFNYDRKFKSIEDAKYYYDLYIKEPTIEIIT